MPHLALLLAFVPQGYEPFPPTPFDRVIPLVIDEQDARLAGHGRAERVRYKAEFSGTLHLWTKAAGDLDLFLRVEQSSGELIQEDDNSGGGKTPYLSLEVEPGRELVIVTAVSNVDGLGAVQLSAIAAPESSATRAADDALQVTLGEVWRLWQSGDLEPARARAQAVLDPLLAEAEVTTSDLLCSRVSDLAFMTHGLSLLRPTQVAREHALRHRLRTLPADHPDLQEAREGLAVAIQDLGDLAGARALHEQVLEVRSRTLPADDLNLQSVRQNLAVTLYSLGDLAGARALFEQVLEVDSRTLPADDPDLQTARGNLAATISALGDLAGARALEEQVLEVRLRTLPPDDSAIQAARQNLAATISRLGDFAGARALGEQALEVYSRTLPADHPDLQAARLNLAATIQQQGDLAGARVLEEQVLDVLSRTLPADSPDLQAVRLNLAATIMALGDLPGARSLAEQVLEVRSRMLPADHPDLQAARVTLALTSLTQASFARRVAGEEEERKRAGAGDRERGTRLLCDRSQTQARVARAVRLDVPGREAEARCARLTEHLDFTLSVVLGYGGLEPCADLWAPALAYSEATRNAAVSSSALARRASKSESYAPARERLRVATEELARLVQGGTSSEGYRAALAAREVAEQALLELGRKASGGKATSLELDEATLSAVLEAGEVAVAYRTYTRWDLKWPDAPDAGGVFVPKDTSVDSLCAFVVRPRDAVGGADPASSMILIDLGPLAPIQAAADAWRAAIGVDLERGAAVGSSAAGLAPQSGVELRRLVLDPLLAQVGDARHVVIVPDGVLHLLPLEALPLESRAAERESKAPAEAGATGKGGASEPKGNPTALDPRKDILTSAPGSALVGDRYRIEVRATLGELLDAPLPLAGTNTLLAVGGASFNSEPVALEAEDLAALEESAPVGEHVTSRLRGTSWERGFEPLPYTGQEARGIEALYTEIFEKGGQALRLEKRKASREALQALAPRARWLHIATHGWLAPESIRSWEDRDPLDAKSGLALRASAEETVKGMSPMLLCGLALAGANLPENAIGRVPGLMTADELSTLDLSNCELAVLSACDTARGEIRRAGQGVASLQKALQIAGARSVITSLWKVPDEATKELMLDFYRRVWVEKKPKWQALWEAKKHLRDAKDESGKPKYALRDWAAWVLTGEPD